jgi:hypothetical protein
MTKKPKEIGPVRWIGKSSFTGFSSPKIQPECSGWGLHPLSAEAERKRSDPKEMYKYFQRLAKKLKKHK